MKLKLEITMDNAAFDPDNGAECARILHTLAAEIEDAHFKDGLKAMLVLRDINGNRVGEAKVMQ